jgi:glycosyltransferase involved in cell wall biosynthesis
MSPSEQLAVLHVDPERGLGGGERQVLGLVERLARAGVRQTVAAHPEGGLAPLVAGLGIPTAPLTIRNHVDVLAARRLSRLLARERYDILHFHTARAHAMAVFLGRAPGVSRVVTRRMDYPLRGGWYARRLYNHEVQAVVAISDGVRAKLIESGVAPGRITVVPSGVEAERFTPSPERRAAARARYATPPAATVLAVVGALETRKGHDVLLRAVARLADPTIVVWCAGDGAERAALEAQRGALGLADRVRFLGRVDDVAELLAGADVCVMPSRHEGLGVAALEAMAAGLPVVASRVGGLPEAIVDGETGCLVPPDDADALAGALARLVADRELRCALGAAGAARARARFSMDAMAAGTLAVYRRLAAREARRG